MNNNTLIEFIRNLLKETQKQTKIEIETYCNSNCDKTKQMRVISIIDDNHYNVSYNNKEYIAFSRHKHKIGEIVYVTICCGNYNHLIIQ